MYHATSGEVDRVIKLGLGGHALEIVKQAGLKPYCYSSGSAGDFWYIDPYFTPEKCNGYGNATRVAIAWCITHDVAFRALIEP